MKNKKYTVTGFDYINNKYKRVLYQHYQDIVSAERACVQHLQKNIRSARVKIRRALIQADGGQQVYCLADNLGNQIGRLHINLIKN